MSRRKKLFIFLYFFYIFLIWSLSTLSTFVCAAPHLSRFIGAPFPAWPVCISVGAVCYFLWVCFCCDCGPTGRKGPGCRCELGLGTECHIVLDVLGELRLQSDPVSCHHRTILSTVNAWLPQNTHTHTRTHTWLCLNVSFFFVSLSLVDLLSFTCIICLEHSSAGLLKSSFYGKHDVLLVLEVPDLTFKFRELGT